MTDTQSVCDTALMGVSKAAEMRNGWSLDKPVILTKNMRKSCGPTGVGPRYAVRPGVGR